MMIDKAGHDPVRIMGSGPVEGHEVLLFPGQALQKIHGIGDENPRALMRLPPEVPAGPGPWRGRQDRNIRMQNRRVLLVAPGSEQLRLIGRGIGKEPQGLVSVGGDEHVVKNEWLFPGNFHAYALGTASDP